MGFVVAGRGHVLVQEEGREAAQLIRGSAERTVGINRTSFDRLIFVNADQENCSELEALRERHSDRQIRSV